MKFSLAFLVAIGLTGVFNVNAVPVKRSSELHDVLDEFLALVPKEKVVAIFMEYLDKDEEVQKVMEYLGSDEFHALVLKIESIEDVVNFCRYLEESGLNVTGLINMLHEVIGLPPIVTGKVAPSAQITGGVAGLWKDILATLPVDKIKALYYEKLETSPAFAELIKRLSSPKCQELFNALRANPEFRKIVTYLRNTGVDVAAIEKVIVTIFGFDTSKQPILTKPAFPRSNPELVADLSEFLALMPMQEIVDVALDYVVNDPEVQRAIAYVKSDEFKTLTTNAEQNDEFRAFVSYLEMAGLPAYQFLNELNRLVDVPEIHPSEVRARSTIAHGTGVRGMLDEIRALLPTEDVKALFMEKRQSSEAFIYFLRCLSTPEFQQVVDNLGKNEDFQKFGYRAIQFGIDVNVIVDFMWRIFGIKITPVNQL